jgi:hypothetical protein
LIDCSVSASEFNFYIPVDVTATPTYGFITLINSFDENTEVVKAFKLFGSIEDYDSTQVWQTINNAPIFALTLLGLTTATYFTEAETTGLGDAAITKVANVFESYSDI